jgi:hypothetical protein
MARTRLPGLLAAFSIAAASSFLVAAPSYAAGNVIDTFELDGNVAQGASGKDDWATVNSGGGSGSIVARTGVLTDPAPRSIFTGGGSKDDLDLSGALSGAGGWKYKDGSVPDKDNIVNAYAAGYNVNGDLVIYAGAERFDNSGDAFMGFWFFKSKISLNANGSFSGVHTPGDVLVLANFQNGGTAVTIQVLEWNPSNPSAGNTNLRLLAGDTVNSALCGSSVSLLYCGITNAAGGETPPWPFLSKSGTTSFLAAEFLEVGINISQVLKQGGDLSAPCFSSFLAETRSSSSVSATLKDFVLGSFDVCGVRITKSCGPGQINATGASIDYAFSGKISNVGFGALTNASLTDTPQSATPAPTVGPFSYYQCDALGKPDLGKPLSSASPLLANTDVCYASTFNTPINGSTNRITVVANTSPTTTTQATSDLATCPILDVQTGMTVDKDCTASLASNGSSLYVKVDFSGSVCNTSAVGLTNVSVTDYVTGMTPVGVTPASTTLGPKGSATECTTYSGTYTPTAADPGSTTQFSDSVRAQGTPPVIAGVPTVTAGPFGATCNLCPGGTCLAPNGATINSLLKQLKTKK